MLDPTLFTPEIYARFIAKVEKTDTCWLWTAGTNDGYGRFRAKRPGYAYAHRWSYEYHVGPVPEGLQLDHLCRVRHCVNPEHLEPVTPRENCIRGEAPAARNAAATECASGHPFSPENTRLKPTKRGIQRQCRECQRIAARRRYQESKDTLKP